MDNNKKEDLKYLEQDEMFDIFSFIENSGSLVKHMEYNKELLESRERTNKFHIVVKYGKKWVDNSALYLKIDCDSVESLHKQIEEIYKEDKTQYLETGIWPDIIFRNRDGYWAHYYYLQLTDPKVKLEKYLDFDYNVHDWPRERIIELANKYGKNILFLFGIYSSTNQDMSFEEWNQERLRFKKYEIELPTNFLHK